MERLLRIPKIYIVPVGMTVLFALGLAGVTTYAAMQHDGAPTRLVGEPGTVEGEVRLVSRDEAEEITARAGVLDVPDEDGSDSSNGSEEPYDPPSRTDNGENGSNGNNDNRNNGGNGGNGSEPDDPPPGFAAEISSIQYNGVVSEDSGLLTCEKTHEFEAVVESDHGPGEIEYSWERDDGDTTETDNINAGSGNNFYSLTHTWTIETSLLGSHEGWVKLHTTEPQSNESSEAEFSHEC